ncbi:hypothetical protein BCAR13_30056 [Paraburkholderia caribensis]|nr:hypothetical protein BCAR13_30056 [Paraburkholderia caribensis]
MVARGGRSMRGVLRFAVEQKLVDQPGGHGKLLLQRHTRQFRAHRVAACDGGVRLGGEAQHRVGGELQAAHQLGLRVFPLAIPLRRAERVGLERVASVMTGRHFRLLSALA